MKGNNSFGQSYVVPLKPFSVEEGIAEQTRDLETWKLVLNEDVFNVVENWTKEKNKTSKDGYGIRRGNSILMFISTVAHKMHETKILKNDENNTTND